MEEKLVLYKKSNEQSKVHIDKRKLTEGHGDDAPLKISDEAEGDSDVNVKDIMQTETVNVDTSM
ncbi:hypothetical protein C0J52_16844 [Blattella germanica]|nr:hypothetical protein C0J52_16844 [Blattella germanica]